MNSICSLSVDRNPRTRETIFTLFLGYVHNAFRRSTVAPQKNFTISSVRRYAKTRTDHVGFAMFVGRLDQLYVDRSSKNEVYVCRLPAEENRGRSEVFIYVFRREPIEALRFSNTRSSPVTSVLQILLPGKKTRLFHYFQVSTQ